MKQLRKIAEAVHEQLLKGQKKLCLAESCTGGLVAASLTAFPSASHYLLGSLVVYSDELKTSLLGVKPSTLKEYGAVSEEVVKELLEGVLSQTSADYALAVSGIAGPTGGSAKTPVGAVWCGIGTKEALHTFQLSLSGTREEIILKAAEALLRHFESILSGSR